MLHFLYKQKITRYLFSICVVIVFCLPSISVKEVCAASLSLTPSSSNVSIGNIISMRIVVDTEGKTINNAEGIVLFPADLLDVISISKSSSIFSLWVEDPKFSNSEGKITFNGGVPNPGYVGSGGGVLSVTFRAKKSGTASIVFSDSAVRENDGLGTDILTKRGSGTVTIKAAADVAKPAVTSDEDPVVVSAPTIVASGAPKAPVVISSTHPDSKKWYNTQNIDLRWDVPDDVSAISYVFGKSASLVPKVVYDPPTGNKNFSKVDDGVWYFNIRFKNKSGWSAITKFKIQIDTSAPNPFKITFPHGDTTDEPRPVAYFNTTDSLSGISYYEVKIGESQFMRIMTQDVSSNPYTPPPQDPGKHNMLVKAVDFAGNETVQAADFTISPINPPKIKDYPTEINEGDSLRIRGDSYPLTSVEVVVEDSFSQESSQISDTLGNGNFTSIWAKNIAVGSYTFKIRAIDARGAKSNYSEPYSFVVKKSAILSVSSIILNWLSVIIIILIACGAILLTAFYIIYRGFKMKRKVDHNCRTFEASIHKAFDLLRNNVREQVQALEKTKSKRDLTKEEEKIIKHLQANLTEAEDYIEKEMLEISNKTLK